MAAVQGYNAIIDSYNPKVAFSGFSVACVGSVSSRVIARKFPSPSPFIPFFCSGPNFLDELARKRLLRRLGSQQISVSQGYKGQKNSKNGEISRLVRKKT